MVVKWNFSDATLSDSYTFEINPNAGGSPTLKKGLTYEKTSASDGKTLIFEGLDDPQNGQFSGTMLSEDQYNVMIDWFNRRHAIQVTDDLGRVFIIYITGFTPQRERAASHPWKHSYTVDYTVLSVVT